MRLIEEDNYEALNTQNEISSKATKLNQLQVQKSSLSLAEINTALSNPQSTQTVDLVFTEAVHQFQIANYLNPLDQDGVIGRSTLETLGFINHGLKQKLNSSGFYGQSQLNRTDVKSQVAVLTNNEFSSPIWYQYILKPSWLGVKITHGIHLLLLRKLKEAEAWLISQPQYKGMTPAALGKAIGFTANTRYSGARLSASKQAMHGFGLALDINVSGNPWIGAGWIKNDKVLLQARYRVIKALRNASGDQTLPGNTIFEYFHHIAQSSGNDTVVAYNTLKQRNDEFIVYLKNNSSELCYWKNSQTFGNRNPLNGFLNLHPDLIYALRQIAGLAWGAIDFGPRASGDIMHFDMRTIGVGKFLCEKIGGYVPNSGHPVINKEIISEEIDHEEFNEDETGNEPEYYEAIEEAEWEENADELEEKAEYGETRLYNDEDDFLQSNEETYQNEPYPNKNWEQGQEEDRMQSNFEEPETDVYLEHEDPPPSLDANIMRDDMQNLVRRGEIIGLDGGQNVNIKLTTSAGDAAVKKIIRVKLVFRTPGGTEKIHEEDVDVPNIYKDPADPGKVIFQKSTPLKNISKILSGDGINEIATVRRDGGTSDKKLLAALGADWRLRGQAVQSTTCGTFSGSFAAERPDALKLLKAGGVAMMELRDSSGRLRVKRFVRNPADVLYYTGHGIGVGFSRRSSFNPPWNCLVIDD